MACLVRCVCRSVPTGLLVMAALAVLDCGGISERASNESVAGATSTGGGGGAEIPDAASTGGGPTSGGAAGSPGTPDPWNPGSCNWPPADNLSSGPCGAWWGGTLAGLSGASTCPCPTSEQFLAYGQTQEPTCFQIVGPLDTKLDGEVTSCLYHMSESNCGNPYTSDSWMDLPYFGGGSGKLELPSVSVDVFKSACGAPAGNELVPATLAERAKILTGVWVKCAGWNPYLDAGLVFHPDGSFQVLTVGANNELVPAAGCNRSGLWGLIGLPANQLDMFFDNGSILAVVTIHAGPPVRIDIDDSAFQSSFVAPL